MENKGDDSKIRKTNLIKSKIIRLIKIVYFITSCIILTSGLIWCFMILLEVIDKGRLPIETDTRFIKGIKKSVGLGAFMGMIYGSILWIILTIIILFVKELKSNLISSKIGLIGLIVSMFILYLILFSEAGKWILD